MPPDCQSGVLPLHHNTKVQTTGLTAIHVNTQDQIWGLTSTTGHDSHIIGERSSNRVLYPVNISIHERQGGIPHIPYIRSIKLL